MKFSVIALLSLSTAVLGTPMPHPASGVAITPEEVRRHLSTSPADSRDVLTKRTPGNVFLCTEQGFTGTCGVVSFDLGASGSAGVCTKLPSPYFQNVGSIGPDPGAICILFTDNTNCQSKGTLMLKNPGDSDLFDHNGVDVGHAATFLQCKRCTACT